MPSFHGHLLGGAITGGLVMFFLGPSIDLAIKGLIIATIGGIWPDIDSQASHINNAVEKLLTLGAILGIAYSVLVKKDNATMLFSLLVLGLLFGLQFTKHRAGWHSITFAALTSVPFLLYANELAPFWIAGYLGHLFLDGTLKI